MFYTLIYKCATKVAIFNEISKLNYDFFFFIMKITLLKIITP